MDNAIAQHVETLGHRIVPFSADIIAKDNSQALLTAKEYLMIDSHETMNNVTSISNRALSNLLRTLNKSDINVPVT